MNNYICGCEDKYFSKGLCNYHYLFDKRLKNPLIQRKACQKWQKKNRNKRTEYFKRYRQTPNGKVATLRAIRKYEASHPTRKKAWIKVRDSHLEKLPCKVCRNINVHAHHPDPLRQLEIIFLCPLHHKQAHLIN